jgi:hypothetical protein
MPKQTAVIANVAIKKVGDKFYLTGKVKDHPRQRDFTAEYQRTSELLSINIAKGTAETLNTIYTLE